MKKTVNITQEVVDRVAQAVRKPSYRPSQDCVIAEGFKEAFGVTRVVCGFNEVSVEGIVEDIHLPPEAEAITRMFRDDLKNVKPFSFEVEVPEPKKAGC